MTKLKVIKAIATDREWKGKKLWKAELSDGVTYDVFITDPNPLLGQEVEVEITESEYGPKAKIITKKAEGSGGGFKGGFGGGHKADPATMVLSYCKDVANNSAVVANTIVCLMANKETMSKTDIQKWVVDTANIINDNTIKNIEKNMEKLSALLPKGDK